MTFYYDHDLAAERLRRCYEIAPARVQQYLKAEIDFVAGQIRPGSLVLELGCGYGRVLHGLTGRDARLIGIDTSAVSLYFAREFLRDVPRCELMRMDAVQMAIADAMFDVVFCIQNGVSAFHVDRAALMFEALRVAKVGGTVLLSSYAEAFWPVRLDWFEKQASAGLVGEIDYDRTGDGKIVCKDGFTATTVDPEAFRALAAVLGVPAEIETVDDSSVFCIIRKPA